MAKTKNKKSKAVEQTEETSSLYYFYSVGCAFCKQVEPIVDELIKEGNDILKLDISEPENRKIAQELSKEYNKQCGTPWLIDANTGNQMCGWKDKESIMKWVNGEDIPTPPAPIGIPPKVPFMNAKKAEIKKWKEDYNKWLEKNQHLPEIRRKTTAELLAMPRPKTEPPKPPAPMATDEEFEKWGKEYTKWKDKNEHLPNLQPTETILSNLKNRRSQMQNQQKQNSQGLNPNQEARLTRLEQKMDKLMKHLGVK